MTFLMHACPQKDGFHQSLGPNPLNPVTGTVETETFAAWFMHRRLMVFGSLLDSDAALSPSNSDDLFRRDGDGGGFADD